jgi:chemotaxis protein methyltransferase CheR
VPQIADIELSQFQRFIYDAAGITRQLRAKVRFLSLNLNAPLPQLGTFDVVFLRNVLIDFNAATKRNVVARGLSTMKPGGHLLIGHSESLVDVSEDVELLAPAIYRKIS